MNVFGNPLSRKASRQKPLCKLHCITEIILRAVGSGPPAVKKLKRQCVFGVPCGQFIIRTLGWRASVNGSLSGSFLFVECEWRRAQGLNWDTKWDGRAGVPKWCRPQNLIVRLKWQNEVKVEVRVAQSMSNSSRKYFSAPSRSGIEHRSPAWCRLVLSAELQKPNKWVSNLSLSRGYKGM